MNKLVILRSGVRVDGHVELRARDALVQRQDIVGRRLEVARGVVGLGDEAVVVLSILDWLKQVRHGVESTV